VLQQLNDLPGRAEARVAFHLLDRRVRPSSEEGKKLSVIEREETEWTSTNYGWLRTVRE